MVTSWATAQNIGGQVEEISTNDFASIYFDITPSGTQKRAFSQSISTYKVGDYGIDVKLEVRGNLSGEMLEATLKISNEFQEEKKKDANKLVQHFLTSFVPQSDASFAKTFIRLKEGKDDFEDEKLEALMQVLRHKKKWGLAELNDCLFTLSDIDEMTTYTFVLKNWEEKAATNTHYFGESQLEQYGLSLDKKSGAKNTWKSSAGSAVFSKVEDTRYSFASAEEAYNFINGNSLPISDGDDYLAVPREKGLAVLVYEGYTPENNYLYTFAVLQGKHVAVIRVHTNTDEDDILDKAMELPRMASELMKQ